MSANECLQYVSGSGMAPNKRDFTLIVQNPCCRETIVLRDLDDRYPHGIQH